MIIKGALTLQIPNRTAHTISSKSYFLLSSALLVGLATLVAIWSFWSYGNERIPTFDIANNVEPVNHAARSNSTSSASRSDDATKEPVVATQKPQSELVETVVSQNLEAEFNLVFDGKIGIADFILRHEKLAQNGNADSMHFLAEAMKDCIVSMTTIQPAIDKIAHERAETTTNREDYRELVRREGRGSSEFAMQEWNNRVDRAYECFSLDKNVATLDSEYNKWESLAVERGQSNAVATFVTTELQNRTPEELEDAKSVIRDILESNKTLETILAAETLSSFVTGRDGTTERAAWALLACEYYDCQSTFSHRYRSSCEVDALYGNIYCTTGMTDSEFLRAKVPENYDLARGRAMELKQLLDQEQWAQIGL